MNAFTTLQMLDHVAMQSDMIAEIDPHGVILSTISILVIFISLLILFIAYTLIGKCIKKIETREKRCAASVDYHANTETAEGAHDKESYVITIKRRTKDRTTVELANGDDISVLKSGIADQTISESTTETDGAQVIQDKGIIKSPLPGTITGLKVNPGDKVSVGQEIATLEAMKMENAIEAEYSGTVTEVFISKGDSVLEGTPIIKIL